MKFEDFFHSLTHSLSLSYTHTHTHARTQAPCPGQGKYGYVSFIHNLVIESLKQSLFFYKYIKSTRTLNTQTHNSQTLNTKPSNTEHSNTNQQHTGTMLTLMLGWDLGYTTCQNPELIYFRPQTIGIKSFAKKSTRRDI